MFWIIDWFNLGIVVTGDVTQIIYLTPPPGLVEVAKSRRTEDIFPTKGHLMKRDVKKCQCLVRIS